MRESSSSPRRYVWRPDLTNLTHEAKAARVSELLPELRSPAKSPRRGRVSKVVSRPRRASDGVHVRAYSIPSWFDRSGVTKKRKLIEAKGLPSFQNWRFITLTMSRDLFDSPLAAYLAGSDHMRRFLYSCRKSGLWSLDAKWCWKFEFQTDGWPHWHLLVQRTKKFTVEELKQVGQIWSLGRVNTKRVNEKEFRYDFKYAFKSVRQDVDASSDPLESMAPKWFLDYIGSKAISVSSEVDGVHVSERVLKPVTFARVRFWQTSRGFYTGSSSPAPVRKPQSTWMIPRTVRQVLDAHESTIQVVARCTSGNYISSTTVRLSCNIRDFWNLVGFDTLNNGAVGLGYYSFVIPTHRIKTDPKTLCLLNPHLAANRLTIRKARFLRNLGQNLQKC